MKKISMMLLAALIIVTLFPYTAYAETETIYSYGGTYAITADCAYNRYYLVGGTTTFVRSGDASVCIPLSITVNPGCNVTFAGDMSFTSFSLGRDGVFTPYPAMKFWGGESVLSLAEGSNVDIYPMNDYAGINVFYDETLTISGSGSLTIHNNSSGAGAGIGGSKGEQSGNIIFDGSVNVESHGGGVGGAGIGGGEKGSCKSITTLPTFTGTIKAYGGNGHTWQDNLVYVGGGTGIGGGCGGEVTGDITLSGGNITAIGGSGGASGIGSGVSKSVSGTIKIAGNTIVDAQAGQTLPCFSGAGIGTGSGGYIEKIEITDTAQVTAAGGYKCPGIGGKGGTIEIKGDAVVNAKGGIYGAGIGSWYTADSPVINISGGEIYAEAGTGGYLYTSGAAIGGATGGGTVSGGINITGGEIIAIPHLDGTGIGAGSPTEGGASGTVHDINISGEAVVYVGYSQSNAIGSSTDLSQGSLNLSDSAVLYLKNYTNKTCPVNSEGFSDVSDFSDAKNGYFYGYKYICPETPAAAYMKYYTIIFYTFAGQTEAPDPMGMRPGGTIIMPGSDKNYNYNGYAVRCWSTSVYEGTEYLPGSEYTVTENDTLYVKWKTELNEYAINYLNDDNTTVSGETAQTVIHGQNASAVTASASYGYVFTGWSDGNESNERQDLNITADATYTAQAAKGTKSIVFESYPYDASLKEFPSPDTVWFIEGRPFALPENVPKRNSYSFVHWDISGTAYHAGETVSLLGSATAYAFWDLKPVVVNDTDSVVEAGTVLIDVLANDYDDFNPSQELTIGRIVTQPAHGTIQTVNGKIEYTHNGDGATSDVFYYKVNDPYGESYRDGRVTVTIMQTNDAPAVDKEIDDQTAYEDTLFEFTIPGDTFSDEENDTLTYIIGTMPGFLEFDGTDTISGTPLNADVGEHTVTVIATDGNGGDTEATFKITVENTNDAPIILAQTHAVDENKNYSSYVAQITASDEDIGDSIVYEILSGNDEGAFALDTAVGEITVQDETLLNFETHPSFLLTVKVTDKSGQSSSADVTIIINDVNDKPMSENSAIETIENEVYTLKESDFHYSDEDGDVFASVNILGQTVNGVLKLNGVPVAANQVISVSVITAGNLKYHPLKDAYGQNIDFFQYRVNDGTEDSLNFYEITFDIVQTYAVTYYDYNSTVLGTEYVADGSRACMPYAPVREGHTFISWTDGTTVYKKDLSDFPAPESDCALRAMYETNKYKLKFLDYNGDIIETMTLYYGEKPPYPSNPKRQGYTFIGWDSVVANMPARDVTVTAQYRINIYTATFLGRKGETIASSSVSYKGTIKFPDNPTESGYHFAGWDNNITVMPAEDITIKSAWVTAVVSLRLEDSLNMKVNDVTTLSVSISPNDAEYKVVEWKSSNESVATVDANGKITAVGVGEAVITASVDIAFDTCKVLVSEQEALAPPQYPAPTATATYVPGSTGITITPSAIKVDEQSGKVIIEINVGELPDDARSIMLPSGEIISLTEAENGTLNITINREELDSEGDFMVVILDEEEIPFGSVNIGVVNDEKSKGQFLWLIWMFGIIGIIMIAVSGILYMNQMKKRIQRKIRR